MPPSIRFVDVTSFAGIRVYQRTAWFLLQKAVRDLYGRALPSGTRWDPAASLRDQGHRRIHRRRCRADFWAACARTLLAQHSHPPTSGCSDRGRARYAEGFPPTRWPAGHLPAALQPALHARVRHGEATSTARWPPRRATSRSSTSAPTQRLLPRPAAAHGPVYAPGNVQRKMFAHLPGVPVVGGADGLADDQSRSAPAPSREATPRACHQTRRGVPRTQIRLGRRHHLRRRRRRGIRIVLISGEGPSSAARPPRRSGWASARRAVRR